VVPPTSLAISLGNAAIMAIFAVTGIDPSYESLSSPISAG
jgi:hypothetical protein